MCGEEAWEVAIRDIGSEDGGNGKIVVHSDTKQTMVISLLTRADKDAHT